MSHDTYTDDRANRQGRVVHDVVCDTCGVIFTFHNDAIARAAGAGHTKRGLLQDPFGDRPIPPSKRKNG